MDPSGRKSHNCGYCCCVGDAFARGAETPFGATSGSEEMDCGCGGFAGLEGDAGGCGEGFVAGERKGLDERVWGMKKAGERVSRKFM